MEMKLMGKSLKIKAIEVKTSKKTGNDYVVLRLEDEEKTWINVIDRNLENKKYYNIGTIADFELSIIITRDYATVSVLNVKVIK